MIDLAVKNWFAKFNSEATTLKDESIFRILSAFLQCCSKIHIHSVKDIAARLR